MNSMSKTLYQKKQAKREFFRKKFQKENPYLYKDTDSVRTDEHLTDEELDEMTYIPEGE